MMDTSAIRCHYNALPAVEAAFEQLERSSTFADLIEATAAVAQDDHTVGLFLNHHHYDLAAGELMVERFAPETHSLDTMPEPMGGLGAIAPSRWMLVADGWLPIEFSADPAVVTGSSALLARYGAPFARLILDHGLETEVGLTISKRSSIPLAGDQSYLEACEPERRAAVITVAPELSLQAETVIPTVWIPAEHREYMYCKPEYLCRIRYGCARGYCRRSGDTHLPAPHAPVPSGHDRTPSGHRSVPDT